MTRPSAPVGPDRLPSGCSCSSSLVVAACAAPGHRRARWAGLADPDPTHAPPLEPAQPGADPISFLAWLFTPIFQAMFIVLVAVYAS